MKYKQTGQEIREILFDKYNKNLCLLAEAMPSLKLDTSKYYCPLCFVPFNKEALYGTCPLLTLEHIVPQGAKGKLVTLTCSKCNNNLGSTIDSTISNYSELNRFAHNVPNIKLNSEIILDGNIRIGGSIETRHDDNRLLHLNSSRMNPKFRQDAIDILSKPFKATFKTKGINTKKLLLGYVKAAYLYAFSKLGYAYIWTINAERVRASIINEDENILKCVLKVQLKKCGLYIITAPHNMQGYLISLPFNTGLGVENISIVLPGFTQEDNFNYLEDDVTFEYIATNDIDILTNKSNFLVPINYWQNNNTIIIQEL